MRGGTAVRSGPAVLFSVAIACLNADAHLAEALESVLAQGTRSYELLVIDGGSSDETLGIIANYQRRFGGRMHAVCEPDDGLYDAMNKALSMASGEYIIYLGADDRLTPGALACVEAVLVASSPGPDIVCGATRVFGSGDSWVEPPKRVVRGGMLKRAPSRHQSIYVRVDAMRAVNGFDTRYGIAADYDLYLRLDAAGVRQVLVGDVLSDFRLGGLSSRNARATAGEYRRVRIAHGANATVESLVMFTSVLAAGIFATWRRIAHGSGRAAR